MRKKISTNTGLLRLVTPPPEPEALWSEEQLLIELNELRENLAENAKIVAHDFEMLAKVADAVAKQVERVLAARNEGAR